MGARGKEEMLKSGMPIIDKTRSERSKMMAFSFVVKSTTEGAAQDILPRWEGRGSGMVAVVPTSFCHSGDRSACLLSIAIWVQRYLSILLLYLYLVSWEIC